MEVQRVPSAGVVEFPALHGAGAWWVEPAVGGAWPRCRGRILHAACGDGWLVRRIVAAGGDAYGVDPRTDARRAGRARRARTCAAKTWPSTCAPWPRRASAAIVLSGVVDGMAGGERTQLLGTDRPALAPGGTLVVHSRDPRDLGGDGRARSRPISRPAARCGPRPGASCWSRAGTTPSVASRARRRRLPGDRGPGHRPPAEPTPAR